VRLPRPRSPSLSAFGFAAHHDHRSQVVAVVQRGFKKPEPLDGGDQDADVAILMMYATWSGFSSGLMGTNTPPAAAAPNSAVTVSGRFSR